MKTLGLIVNPIAGMGGKVGLKGTDGEETLEQARALGALPQSPKRAEEALRALASGETAGTLLPGIQELRIVTPPGEMGEYVVREAGRQPEVLGMEVGASTTCRHTREAAAMMMAAGVDLILFAGGDGTARDIVAQVQDQVACLGIPAGVKMHSAVFAVNPARGGELAAHHLFGGVPRVRAGEVMDIDEEALREGHVHARLFGYLRVPYRRGHVQGLKAGSTEDEFLDQQAIAAGIVDRMEKDVVYVVGPGTTTAEIMKLLGLEFSLVGVDLVRDKQLWGRDLGEQEIMALLGDGPGAIIVTPVGGQGFLFGRGNQPISANVIRQVGRDRITIAATPNKLASFRGEPLRVDSGDADTDQWLAGYYKVVSGYRDRSVYRIAAA